MDEDRIDDKIKDIDKALEELTSLFPIEYDNYMGDFKIRAICEHYFEKIIEAVVDIAFLIIRGAELDIPDDDKGAFFVLSKNKIISDDLARKFKAAKGMRNVIAHEYGKIDDEKVYYSVSEELCDDVEEFIKEIDFFIKEFKKNETKKRGSKK